MIIKGMPEVATQEINDLFILFFIHKLHEKFARRRSNYSD